MFDDWNYNGYSDPVDEFIEHEIINDSTFDSNNPKSTTNVRHSTGGSKPNNSAGDVGCFVLLLVANIFLLLLDLFTS
ncbi:MAG: hypothetical protein IKU72_04925 [Oscillospiraceae bacterium]|nr:hypothetical protein [Oscillospiraceae bacterium]